MKPQFVFRQSLLIVAVVLAMWSSGCKEKDVPFVSDIDYMLQYLERSEDGVELFRWDSLIVPSNYKLPFTAAVFRDSVTGHTRTVDFNEVLMKDFGVPVGVQPSCYFRVTDLFQVRTRKIDGIDTTFVESQRSLLRSGVFAKLGSDYEPFLGWVLWSYCGRGAFENGSATLQVLTTFQILGQTPAAYDQEQLVRLTSLKSISNGATVVIRTTSNTPDNLREPSPILSAASDSGFMQRSMDRIDRDHYVDTLKTPTGNKRLWNLIYIQTFHDTEFFFTGGYFIPYRVPQ